VKSEYPEHSVCDCAWLKGWSVGVVYLFMAWEYPEHFVFDCAWLKCWSRVPVCGIAVAGVFR